MGVSASRATAPQPATADVAESAVSRRRSSLLFWTNRNLISTNSSNPTSRSSVCEVGVVPHARDLPDPEDSDRDDRRSRAGPTESTFSTSNRSLLCGLKRRISKSNLRQQQSTVAELWKELQLVKRNILSEKPWIDGVYVMWIVVSNTVTSVLAAWLVTCIYAVGSPIAPMISFQPKSTQAAPQSNSLLFATAVGAHFVTFMCLSHAIISSCILADRLVSIHRSMRHSFVRTFASYIRVVLHLVALAVAAGAGVMAALDQCRARCGRIYHVRVLVLLFIGSFYIDYVVRHARYVRRRMLERLRLETTNNRRSAVSRPLTPEHSLETIGAALDNSAAVVPPPGVSPLRHLSTMSIIPRTYTKTLFEKLTRDYRGFAIMCIGVMFGYLHLSLALRLTHKWQISLFAALSLILKITMQEATKQLFLSPPRKPSARSTHMVMTLPTVLIDAQIRMVFVQIGLSRSDSSSSVFTISFIVVVCKIFFRLAKILRLRHTIKSRLSHSRGMQRILRRINSRVAARDVALARAEYSQFLDWKNHKLRLHAAEVYVDMHGEYISIGLAMAILCLLTNHPMYSLRNAASQIHRQVMSALVQMGTGLAFDYIASVVEGVHEVPLYEAIGDEGRRLRVFMHVLSGAITSANVGLSPSSC